MFKELYDRLTMTEQEKEDRKRFNALVKDFAKEFGLDEEKVSKSREVVYDVLYGGYNKKETTAFIRDSVMESTYGMVADIMDSVGDYELAENVKRGVKNYLNKDLQAIQQVNEVVYDMNMEEKIALKINSKSAVSGVSKEAETADKEEQLRRKGSLAKKPKNNKTVEASRGGMELGGI